MAVLSYARPILRRLFRVPLTTCKQQFQRLLSFGSTDGGGDCTTDDVEAPPPALVAAAAAAAPVEGATAGTVVLELDLPAKKEPKPWHTHVGKSAQPVSLFFAGTSVALFMNPLSPLPHAVVLVGHTGAIYLGFCMGAGLSIYSIFRRPSPAAARVQVRLMLVGFGSVLSAIVLRTVNVVSQVMNPRGSLWLFLLLGVPGVVLVVLIVPCKAEAELAGGETSLPK